MMKVQGFFLIDVNVVALNNAGKSTATNNDNAVATKKVFKHGRPFTYVSGQAVREWWRRTLQTDLNWPLSPITRDKKIAFTAASPFEFADDDVFGYLKAGKDTVLDEQGEKIVDGKGKEKTEDITVSRRSPLNNSPIVSVAPVSIARPWSVMARHEGDPVPFGKEEYSSIMQAQFSLDVDRVGTFSSYNRTGFKNLTEKQRLFSLDNGCTEIDDPFVVDKNGFAKKLIQMPKELRIGRAVDTIKALKTISGGAMQATNMADVTPKFIILASFRTGNHPFGNIMCETPLPENAGPDEENTENTPTPYVNRNSVILNIDAIKEILKDYKDLFIGTVFIGKRTGFLDEYSAQLAKLTELGKDYPSVKYGTIGEAIDNYCEQLKSQIV